MTHDRDYGQPWPPQQGDGQPHPQNQQWPPRYDPRDRGQRLRGPQGQPQYLPQGQPPQGQQWRQLPAQHAPQGYGQVQPYAPPQPYQGYPQYGQPQYAPPIAPKSTAAGLILGLLWPGVGCMYAGRVGIGILLMGIWLISIPLVFVVGLGFITGFCTWIASAILGYTMTRAWNAAHGIVSLSADQRSVPSTSSRKMGRCSAV
jgi:TM2 domain-containing membrane protein YozV